MMEADKLLAVAETMQEGLHRGIDDQYDRLCVLAETITLPSGSDTQLIRWVLHTVCVDVCLRKNALKQLERA